MDNKKFRKARLTAATLAIVAALGTLTACSGNITNKNTNNDKIETGYHESISSNSNTNTNSYESQIKGNPFEIKKWKGEEYLTIKEDALRTIIQQAMNDAEKFYTGIGAPNMKLDSNFKVVSGKGNFYPEWMDENYFMARAKQESGIYMINYRAGISNSLASDPQGIMQVNPADVKPTLEEYYKNIFNENVSLDKLQTFPSSEDVKNYKSTDAQKNILESVYNNVYLSICFDIYATKCLNPGHADYYAPYGGFSDELRQKAVVAQYLWGLGTISSSMKDGSFEQKYGNSKYVTNILNFQDEFEAKYDNSNQME